MCNYPFNPVVLTSIVQINFHYGDSFLLIFHVLFTLPWTSPEAGWNLWSLTKPLHVLFDSSRFQLWPQYFPLCFLSRSYFYLHFSSAQWGLCLLFSTPFLLAILFCHGFQSWCYEFEMCVSPLACKLNFSVFRFLVIL